MTEDNSTHAPSPHGLEFSIRASRLITGVTFEGLDFEVRNASPAEAERLIEHFWAQARQSNPNIAADPELDDRFGDIARMKDAMLRLGWSQTELADRSGVSIQTISGFFRRRNGLSPGKRLKLLRTLGIGA